MVLEPGLFRRIGDSLRSSITALSQSVSTRILVSFRFLHIPIPHNLRFDYFGFSICTSVCEVGRCKNLAPPYCFSLLFGLLGLQSLNVLGVNQANEVFRQLISSSDSWEWLSFIWAKTALWRLQNLLLFEWHLDIFTRFKWLQLWWGYSTMSYSFNGILVDFICMYM